MEFIMSALSSYYINSGLVSLYYGSVGQFSINQVSKNKDQDSTYDRKIRLEKVVTYSIYVRYKFQ